MASKISKEVTAIQRGFGEKVGQVTRSLFSFLLGYSFAFYYGYKYTLILLAGFPILMIIIISFGLALNKGVIEQMRAYA